MPQFLTDDGVTIVYDDLGPRDGIPVVFCHGLASAGVQHAADAEYFSERGFRVLVPDVRGHGRSGKPNPMTEAGFTAPRMAADLLMMLDDAEAGPVHWVGNSLGGVLGLELLARSEARFRTFASFGTTYSLGVPQWAAQAIPMAYGVFGRGRYASLAAGGMTRDPAARKLIASVVEKWDVEAGLLIARNLTRYNLIPNALAAQLPILLLRCGRDPQTNLVLGATLRVMRDRANFALVEVPQGGHCANLDATEQVRAELLKFWGRAAGV